MKKRLITLFTSFALCFGTTAQLSFMRCDTVQVIDESVPLKNAWAGGLNYPMVEQIDLNGDGIMDIVMFEPGGLPGHYRLMPFLNYGDSGKVDYHYAPQYISQFPKLNQWMLTYDYNCDGKMDLFTLSDTCSCGIEVYRNDYTPGTGLKFTKIVDPILSYYGTQQFNVTANSVAVPALGDVDGDGIMDIIAWPPVATGSLEYHRGLAADSGWSCDSLRFKDVSECWGHFALTADNNLAYLAYCRMMTPDSALYWDAGMTVNDDTQSCICLYEQDSTLFRKKSVLIGGYADNNMIFLHNAGASALSDSMNREDYDWPVYNVPVNLPSFPCAYNLDVDNDHLKDMIVSPHTVNDYRGVLYYKNTDVTSDSGYFTRQPHTFLQEEMIDVGSGSAPQLFDYDADGLPDLLIGDQSYFDTLGVYHKGITLYKNVGTPSAPKFQLITRDYAGIDGLVGVGGTLCPTFGDLRGNGVMDMIVGMGNGPTEKIGNGHLLYYQNTAAAGNPANFVLTSNYFDSIHVGTAAAPQLYDLDHDGLLDLIVGNSFGFIKYYRNLGTITNPIFNRDSVKDTLGGIITQYPGFTTGYASPFFYNDHGVDKLVVGTEAGKVYVYDNINGNILGTYHLADSLINGEEGQNLVVTIGDINNDGRPDMIIGNYNGGLSLYMNSFGTGVNELKGTILPSFDAYPNPTTDGLHLDFYHIEGEHAHLEIFNNIGQIVYRAAVTEQKMTISLKHLSSGIYLARFISRDNAQSLKIVVRH